MNHVLMRQSPEGGVGQKQYAEELRRKQVQDQLRSLMFFEEDAGEFETDQEGRVREVREQAQMDFSHLRLPNSIEYLPEVFLPPSKIDRSLVSEKEEHAEKKPFVPRVQYLMEVLTDLAVTYDLKYGKVDRTMMRKETYVLFVLSEINKLVLVNNEPKNATYLVQKTEDVNDWREFIRMKKEELQLFIDEGLVTRVVYHDGEEQWKKRVKEEILRGPSLKKGEVKDVLPPEGAMTGRKLREILPWGNDRIREEWDRLQIEHPEWFGEFTYSQRNKHRTMFLSKEGVEFLKKKADAVEVAEDGWNNTFQLTQKLSENHATITRWAKRLGEGHPEWFEVRKVSANNAREVQHYAPELCQKLEAFFSKVEAFDATWETVGAFAVRLGVDSKTVQKRITRFKDTVANPMRWQKDSVGRPRQHLSPELMALIESDLRKDEV